MWLGLALEFARRGHEVAILARAYPGQAAQETIEGVSIVRFGGFGQSRFVALDLLRNLFYSLRATSLLPSADILVTNDFWLPMVAAALRPAAGRVVVNANRFPKGQYRLYRRAAFIAAASTVVAREVARQCPALASRIRVVANPIDTHVFRPLENRAARRDRTLLYVGRLHPEKGIHILIEALAMFFQTRSDWRLRLVGPISEDQGGGGHAYEERLRSLAKDLPVEWMGPVFDHVELARILREGTLFCYPSVAETGEALPVAPLEAMACGLPIVTSDLECFRDYLVEGETGFVFDHRASSPGRSLADRIEALASKPALLARVGARAAERATDFGYVEVADRFLAEFEKIVGSAAQR